MQDTDYSFRPMLMIPGPVDVSYEVLSELSKPLLPHYGEDWGSIYEGIIKGLKKIFNTSYQVMLFPTPSSAIIEVGIVNLVEPKGELIVVSNGFFGERVAEIATYSRRNVVRVEADHGEVVPPEAVAKAFEESPDASALFSVHVETSTGISNPIREYGKVAREYGAIFMVDAVSSFGGMELNVDNWNIDYCIGYASKALGGVPGLTPVSISERAWEFINSRSYEPPTWYFNLKIHRWYVENWGKMGHPYPTTMPSHSLMALRKALDMAIEEGLDYRYRRHAEIARAFRAGIRAMGLEVLAPEEYAASTVTAVLVPEGTDSKIRDIMLRKYNLMISGGLSKLVGKVVRIGHMGAVANPKHVSYALLALGSALEEIGFKVNLGKALETFAKEFRKPNFKPKTYWSL